VRIAQNRRIIWIVDAHRDGTRFLVRADEILIAFFGTGDSALRVRAGFGAVARTVNLIVL
jgi:hypothetical protein